MEKLLCNSLRPPIGGLAAAELVKANYPVAIEWGTENAILLRGVDNQIPANNNDILRTIARIAVKERLYGSSPFEQTQVDHWLSFALSFDANLHASVQYLQKSLAPLTFLVTNTLTIADLAVFTEVNRNFEAIEKLVGGVPNHVQRWYTTILHQSCVAAVLSLEPFQKNGKPKATKANSPPATASGQSERKQEGKFVELPGAEMGKVIVRFPPEASGYLHIGHAKAALLNQYYQEAFQGKLIMRFDDTNPAKETVEFEQVILGDLKLLEIKPDLFTHTSQYFDLILSLCEKLMKEGKAYVDDTNPEQMKIEREQKQPSAHRTNSVEKNFEMWKEMLKGSASGQKCCVRAKIYMDSPNGCMRDPTIYRCKNEPHPRTGNKYKVYPTYDFACPIVDSIEDVTHTLRTMEYHDRDDQFYWFIDALELRKPYIWEYSRLNMTNTVLSKRKLTWFVEEGLVDGWDDPRFPTVRGVLRRGMTVKGLRDFIIAQGSSKSAVTMEWDKIWAINKKVIDPIAPRYTAVDKNPVLVNVAATKRESIQVPAHPKNTQVGTKTVWLGPRVLIDEADAESLKVGEVTTFINWGNLMIDKINRNGTGKILSVDATPNLDNKDFKKTLKITWLCEMEASEFPRTYCVFFEHIISKAVLAKNEDFKAHIAQNTRTEVEVLGDPELKNCKEGDIIQLTRRGFFRVDSAYAPASEYSSVASPVVLFEIPDGSTKDKPTSGQPKKAAAPVTSVAAPVVTKNAGADINENIIKQGEIVRDLKAKKAAKPEVDVAVKTLLALKADYKQATGQEWKPGAIAATVVAAPTTATLPSLAAGSATNEKIVQQGNLVRDLKAAKATKLEIEGAVKQLLALKVEYKNETGQDWKPGTVPVTAATNIPAASNSTSTSDRIVEQGNLVRDLKAAKVAKPEIDAAVNGLLALKADYKRETGQDWKPNTVIVQPVASVASATSNDAKIVQQGNIVRDLKAAKAPKSEIDKAVKELLALKADYKRETGQDWKPGTVPVPIALPVTAAPVTAATSVSSTNDKIVKQGNLVRDLKTGKAAKPEIDAAVKELLALKANYKKETGHEWQPGTAVATTPAPTTPAVSKTSNDDRIVQQGNLVRDLKGQKASKADIDAAVKELLALKANYKKETGNDWKPIATPAVSAAQTASVMSVCGASDNVKLDAEIVVLGNAVRELKLQKAAKADIDAAVKSLLALKAEYKSATGSDWKPSSAPAVPVATPTGENAILSASIAKQGDKVRDLKAAKGDKSVLDAEVKTLLTLKVDYKKLTGADWKPVGGAAPTVRAPSKPKAAPQPKPAAQPTKTAPKVTTDDGVAGGPKKQTRLGMEALKGENLAEWYSQVLTKSELIEYYDVSGCYILRPWAMSIWRAIHTYLHDEITRLGVKEVYFPMFVSKAALQKEKDHIADFSPEVAWVTKSGDSDLAEPIAIRPTSETIMYPAFAKWIQSYRDLPLRLNQWSNIVRWEFKHPQPFLRTREFLWQEGHSAFADVKEAEEEVLAMLEVYAAVYEELLAVPVRRGRKTEKEKFAGGDYTTTVEAFVSASGRSIQGATSHHLGQNFSKMFDIIYEDPVTQEKKYVYQNSWGMTTRTVGVMIMVHGDDKGLVVPPRVASVQAILVPCGITVSTSEAERAALQKSCNELEVMLRVGGVRAEGDYRDNYSPGWKFNHWELKGVPIRIELGPKDMKANQLVIVRRDTGEKQIVARNEAVARITEVLANIQSSLFAKAQKDFDDHLVLTKDWTHFCSSLESKKVLLSPFCGDKECEGRIKDDSAISDENAEAGTLLMGAKSLCIPFKQPANIVATDKCIYHTCTKKPLFYTLFGRSY